LFLSWLLIALLFPFSMFVTLKVVQEYEYNDFLFLQKIFLVFNYQQQI